MNRPELRLPVLMLVTDTTRRPNVEATGEAWLDDIVRDAVLGGVSAVQLREKHLSRGDLVALGLHVRDAIAGRAQLFVNGDIEAAMALRADGLHLPADGSPVDDARAAAGKRIIISRAVHSVEAAARAEEEGADLLVLGTVFASKSHPGGESIGVKGVHAVCERVRTPVVAIGGITAANAGDVMRAGASGVAVISAIFDAPDPRAAAGALRASIDAAWAEREQPKPA